jgi:hypothetical protein
LVKDFTIVEKRIGDVKGNVPPPPVAGSDRIKRLVALLDSLSGRDRALVAGGIDVSNKLIA